MSFIRSREILFSNRTYYVRTDGSDSNNGLNNNAGGAFITIQKAMDVIATLDFNGFTITIQLGNSGTFGPVVVPVTVGQAGVSNLVLVGDTVTPTNTVINNSSGSAVTSPIGTSILCTGFKVTASSNGLFANGGKIYIADGVNFGTCGTFHILAQAGGYVESFNSYKVSGNAIIHWGVAYSSSMLISATIDFGGAAIAFSGAFAQADGSSSMQVSGCTFSNSASVTGTRFSATGVSLIQTFGAGATYLPGNASGTPTYGSLGTSGGICL